MTKRQYNMAVRIIKADCKVTGTMLEKAGCKNPQTCAVGALAWAACDNKPTIRQQNALVACGGLSGLFKRFVPKIKRKFGLDHDDLYSIMKANDSVDYDVRARRKKVLERLQAIAKEQYELEV